VLTRKYTAHFGIFAYGWYSQATNSKLALLNTLRYSVWVSRGAGLVLALDGSLILLPVLRNVLCYIRPKLRSLPLDQNIFFHKQVAYSIVFWAMVHTTAHYVNFYNVEATQARPVKAWQIHYTEIGGITGVSQVQPSCFYIDGIAHHVTLYGPNVHDSANQDQEPMFRSLLVHAPSGICIYDCSLLSCLWLLR
jgi:hypothetical protein